MITIFTALSLGIDNGLGLLPPMGWRDWTAMGGTINQQIMEDAMTAMQVQRRCAGSGDRSFVDLGYTHVGLDDAWQKCGAGVNGSFHDANGKPIVDTDRFPDMKAMVSFGTQHGIQVGWYGNNCKCSEFQLLTDPAFLDKCLVGTVSALVEYNFTALKLDGCGPHRNLTRWAEAINASGHATLVEDCHWGGTVPLGLGGGPGDDGNCNGTKMPSECPYNFYRSSGDTINTYERVWANVHSLLPFIDPPPTRTAASHSIALSRPGAWAYPDTLELGRMQSSGAALAAEEDRTFFGWYVITSSPLILGHNITDAATNDRIWDIVSNSEAIAINQAWFGHAGALVKTWGPPASAPTVPWVAGHSLFNVTCDASDVTQRGWSWDAATSALQKRSGKEGTTTTTTTTLCVDTQAADNRQLWTAACIPKPQHGHPQAWSWGPTSAEGFATLTSLQTKKLVAVPGAQNSVGFGRNGEDKAVAQLRVNHAGSGLLESRNTNSHPNTTWCIAARELNPVHDPSQTYELWAKVLKPTAKGGQAKVAVLLVNNGITATLTFDPFTDLKGYFDASVTAVAVRDVWAHADVPGTMEPGGGYSVKLKPHASALLILQG
jgi:alpha-galactosidase